MKCIFIYGCKKILYMKWLHNLLKGFSLTTALFIFQACYGTPEMYRELCEWNLSFKVLDADTGNPLEGVKVSNRQYGNWHTFADSTNADGILPVSFGTYDNAPMEFRFEAPDAVYSMKDTTFIDSTPREIEIRLPKVPSAE